MATEQIVKDKTVTLTGSELKATQRAIEKEIMSQKRMLVKEEGSPVAMARSKMIGDLLALQAKFNT